MSPEVSVSSVACPPVIGISCYVEQVDRFPWVAQRAAVLPHDYVRQVEQAGGVAVVLPPRVDATEELAAAVVDRLDGLIIAGGADVEASRYGAAPHPSSQAPRPDRDIWEASLVAAAIACDLPLLGICRGMQVLAVEAGAGLIQHLPDVVGHERHSPAPGVYSSHEVRVVPGSLLAGVIGQEPRVVPTYHHQSVRPGTLEQTPYVASAWHDDGTLEAMDDPTGRFRLAVQWHPEAGTDGRIFEALVDAATGTQ